jgi:hypothetical protein
MSSGDQLVLQLVGAEFVSRVGSLRKTDGGCRHGNCLNEGVQPKGVWL